MASAAAPGLYVISVGDLRAPGDAGGERASLLRCGALSDPVLTTESDRVVVGFTEEPRVDYRVSTGVYGVSRDTLNPYPPGPPLGFDELVLDPLAADAPPHAYDFDGYWLDTGRPDATDRANAECTQRRGVLIKGA